MGGELTDVSVARVLIPSTAASVHTSGLFEAMPPASKQALYLKALWCWEGLDRTRLVTAIADSPSLTSRQMNVESMPEGPDNPFNVGFVARERPLRTEAEAQRMADVATSRYWKIKNPRSINPLNGASRTTQVCHVR